MAVAQWTSLQDQVVAPEVGTVLAGPPGSSPEQQARSPDGGEDVVSMRSLWGCGALIWGAAQTFLLAEPDS